MKNVLVSKTFKVLIWLSSVFALHSAIALLNIGVEPSNVHSNNIIYTFISGVSFLAFVSLFLFSITQLVIAFFSQREGNLPVSILSLIVSYQLFSVFSDELVRTTDHGDFSMFVSWVNFIFLMMVILKLTNYFPSDSIDSVKKGTLPFKSHRTRRKTKEKH